MQQKRNLTSSVGDAQNREEDNKSKKSEDVFHK